MKELFKNRFVIILLESIIVFIIIFLGGFGISLLPIKMSNVSVHDYYIAQITVTFLITSLMAGLSEKNRYVYWEDMVQETLILPKGFSFKDIMTYEVAAFVFSTIVVFGIRKPIYLIASFLLSIVLVIFLIDKMLRIYFGEKSFRAKLEKEAQQLYDDANGIRASKAKKELDEKKRKVYFNTLILAQDGNWDGVEHNLDFLFKFEDITDLKDDTQSKLVYMATVNTLLDINLDMTSVIVMKHINEVFKNNNTNWLENSFVKRLYDEKIFWRLSLTKLPIGSLSIDVEGEELLKFSDKELKCCYAYGIASDQAKELTCKLVDCVLTKYSESDEMDFTSNVFLQECDKLHDKLMICSKALELYGLEDTMDEYIFYALSKYKDIMHNSIKKFLLVGISKCISGCWISEKETYQVWSMRCVNIFFNMFDWDALTEEWCIESHYDGEVPQTTDIDIDSISRDEEYIERCRDYVLNCEPFTEVDQSTLKEYFRKWWCHWYDLKHRGDDDSELGDNTYENDMGKTT